jgi:hypothetical protein
VLAAVAWGLGAGANLLILTLAAAGAWALRLHERVERTVGAGDRAGRELRLLSQLLAHLEGARFEAPFLLALQAGLCTDGVEPSVQVRRLARLQDLVESRRNQLFAPLALPLLWTTQLALAIEPGAWASAPRCRPGWPRWESSRRSARWPLMPTNAPRTRFRRSWRTVRASTEWSSAILSSPPPPVCATTCAWTITSECSWSAGPTCPGRARSCARWG